jgi:hypothetical protein
MMGGEVMEITKEFSQYSPEGILLRWTVPNVKFTQTSEE